MTITERLPPPPPPPLQRMRSILKCPYCVQKQYNLTAIHAPQIKERDKEDARINLKPRRPQEEEEGVKTLLPSFPADEEMEAAGETVAAAAAAVGGVHPEETVGYLVVY